MKNNNKQNIKNNRKLMGLYKKMNNRNATNMYQ